jgi:hypothetical protein
MAEKPKIDLKARLGKAQVGQGVPAPVAPAVPGMGRSFGSVPAPAVGSAAPPAAGFGASPAAQVGVPMPPFGGGAAGPSTDAFGARVAASPMSRAPAPTTIKIELDEETVRAARRGGKRAGIFASITAVGGMVLGFAFGQRSSDSKVAQGALMGAQDLIGDIDKSQAKIKELGDKIAAAVTDLKNKKYPEAFANELGGLSIPFGADKLAGRNIGRFDPRTLSVLFDYTGDVEALNDRKDALKNLFSGQKAAIIAAIGSAQTPKVSWSVFVQKSPAHGPVAILAAVGGTDAFPYKDAWPAKFKLSTGRELVDAERYNGGDVFTTSPEKKIVAIPIDPDSVAASFPTDVLSRITSELAKTSTILAGNGTPGDDNENGVLKKGEALLTALKRIGQK